MGQKPPYLFPKQTTKKKETLVEKDAKQVQEKLR
jgi:hypothetical protein